MKAKIAVFWRSLFPFPEWGRESFPVRRLAVWEDSGQFEAGWKRLPTPCAALTNAPQPLS
jgi:hypothetical protein